MYIRVWVPLQWFVDTALYGARIMLLAQGPQNPKATTACNTYISSQNDVCRSRLKPPLLTRLLTCKPWVCMFVVFGEWNVLMGSLPDWFDKLFSVRLFICETTKGNLTFHRKNTLELLSRTHSLGICLDLCEVHELDSTRTSLLWTRTCQIELTKLVWAKIYIFTGNVCTLRIPSCCCLVHVCMS